MSSSKGNIRFPLRLAGGEWQVAGWRRIAGGLPEGLDRRGAVEADDVGGRRPEDVVVGADKPSVVDVVRNEEVVAEHVGVLGENVNGDDFRLPDGGGGEGPALVVGNDGAVGEREVDHVKERVGRERVRVLVLLLLSVVAVAEQ